MKKLIYICCLTLFFINTLSAQCINSDANIWKDTWASCDKTPNPIAEYGNSHWIQYNFGSVRNLSKTWVWNTNDPTQLNQGFNLVKIDYSEDGEIWTNLGEMNFPKAEGAVIYSGFSGPDFSNLKAQYVLLTAISNHGNASCAGLAEIKFNLLPEAGIVIPETTEEEDDDDEDIAEDDDEDDDDNQEDTEEEEEEEGDTDEDDEEGNDENIDDICDLIEEVDLTEFVEIETESTEAFFFLEIDEEMAELPFIFEFRSPNDEWIMVEMEDGEIFLEDLVPGTTYDYRISLDCGDAMNSTPINRFQTIACASMGAISVEEVTETEIFLLWQALEDVEEYFIEFRSIEEAEIWDFEVEEAEVFLDELDPNTTYEIRIGIPCGEAINWSETIEVTTNEENDFSSVTNTRLNLSTRQVHLFPNPTPGQLTVRIKTQKNDVLNYSISDMQGRILFRNTTKLYSGTNDLSLDLSNLTDGTYWINGVTINQRAQISEPIIKISK